MYVRMYIRMMYVCMYVYTYVRVHACMYVCVCVCVCVCVYKNESKVGTRTQGKKTRGHSRSQKNVIMSNAGVCLAERKRVSSVCLACV